MPVYKRYKKKRVKHGSSDYARATWYAEGHCEGVRYKQSIPTAKTREQAVKEEDKIKARIREGEFDFHKDTTTFKDYVETIYLPHIKINNTTWDNNKKYSVERLVLFFKDSKLKIINRTRCEDFKRHRSQEKVICQKCSKYKERCFRCKEKANKCWACKKRDVAMEEHRPQCKPRLVETSTVNRDLKVLSHILSLAVVDGKIKENPMKHVPLLKEPDSRQRILSQDEKQRLLNALGSNKKLLAIVTLALTTGWRKGQILAVKKEDLNYEFKSVIVSKSKKSPARQMPVSDVAWQIFIWLSSQVTDGYLFRNDRTGEQLKDFKDSWWASLEKANITDFHFHDLRRTCASELLRLSVNEFTIRDVLGHTKIDTTQIYARVQDEDLRDGLNRLGENYDSEFLM